MVDVPRIGVNDARRKVQTGEALLVCAYADEAKCRKVKLEGSLTLAELPSRLSSLPKHQALIFYCA